MEDDVQRALAGDLGAAAGDHGHQPDNDKMEVEMSVVTDAAAFCRLIANRLTPSDLDVHVTGDPAVTASILHAATTLALD